MLAHPFQPELTQLDHVLLITDPTDKALFVHFVNLARTVGHGWVEYMWPIPGKTTPSKKLSYIYDAHRKQQKLSAKRSGKAQNCEQVCRNYA